MDSQLNLSIACVVISAIAVVIRIYCKIRHKQGVRSDDYWIIVGLAFYAASVSIVPMVIWGRPSRGGGLQLDESLEVTAKDPSNIHLFESYLEIKFLVFLILTCATYAIKMSIIFFYRHALLVTQGYRRISLGLIVSSTAWFIGTEMAALLICQPVDAFWHRTKPGKCSNFNAVFLGTGIVDSFIDLIILLLPLRIIFTLNLPMRTRVAVAVIFVLGGLAVITNIMRIQYVYHPYGHMDSFASARMWTNIHPVTAIVCACLPIYKPLWVSASQGVKRFLSRYASTICFMRGIRSNKPKDTSNVRMGTLGNHRGSGTSEDHIMYRHNPVTDSKILERPEVTVAAGGGTDTEASYTHIGDITHHRELAVV